MWELHLLRGEAVPLSLFILSKIKSYQLIHIFLNTGDGKCKPKEKTTIPGRIQAEERMDL